MNINKLMKIFSILTFLFLPLSSFALDIDKYLPKKSKVKARVMQIGASTELETLATKMKKSMQKNQEWAQSYIKKAPKGKPLPYHPNLGLTKEEYKKLFKLFENAISLQQVELVDLTIEKSKNEIKLSTNSSKVIPKGISINTDKDFAKTKYGKLSKIVEINQDNPDSPTGSWKGFQLSHTQLDINSNPQWEVKFAIGKRTKTKDGIIYYDVKRPYSSEVFHYVLLYELE